MKYLIVVFTVIKNKYICSMIKDKTSLQQYNTFGIEAYADHFASFGSVEELKSLLSRYKNEPIMILGGGSNVLFTHDYNGAVLHNEIKGIQQVSETEEHVHLKVGSGEVWHEFVMHCVNNDLGGVENLSLIPGSVGASPMQNIGAYGVEIKDVFISLEALHIETQKIHSFTNEECEFGYRESVFKRKLKGQYIITSVTYQLTRKNHVVHSSYGAIQSELEQMGVSQPTIKNISDAVIAIRSSKLPDPKKIGNAGSFFKNPVVDKSVLEKIEREFDNVPNYPASVGKVKLAAGWLIEKAGWKGKTFDAYGVHKDQALVLVNYGGAKGNQIYNLSSRIIEDIQKKFGITLEREVNII